VSPEKAVKNFSFATQQKKPSQSLLLLWLRSKASEAKKIFVF
jgi:hypothetical protein